MKFKLTEASVDDYVKDFAPDDDFSDFEGDVKDTAQKIDADVVPFKKPVKFATKGLKKRIFSDPNGDIERELTSKLEIAIEAYEDGTNTWKNVLFVGPPGSGKTSRIKAWAQAHGVNVVTKLCSVMDEVDINGIPAAVKRGGTVVTEPDKDGKVGVSMPLEDEDIFKRLGATDFDELDEAPEGTIGSVLFLDEFNRGNHNVRGALLNLIQDHEIPAGKHMRKLQDYLFTIAAINPAGEGSNGIDDDLNDAEVSRFAEVPVANDPRNTKAYLDNLLDYKLEVNAASDRSPELKEKIATKHMRQRKLADTILSSPQFSFDTKDDIEDNKATDTASLKAGANGKVLSARSFESALLGSDGTVNSFRDEWQKTCNGLKWNDIAKILHNYSDKVDKANSVFSSPRPDIAKKNTQTPVAQPAQNAQPVTNNNTQAPVDTDEEPDAPTSTRKEKVKFTGGFDNLDLD